MPARRLELPALLLDLVEQPGVLHRDRRLVSEAAQQRHLAVGEIADAVAADEDGAEAAALPQQWPKITDLAPMARQPCRVLTGTPGPYSVSG